MAPSYIALLGVLAERGVPEAHNISMIRKTYKPRNSVITIIKSRKHVQAVQR